MDCGWGQYGEDNWIGALGMYKIYGLLDFEYLIESGIWCKFTFTNLLFICYYFLALICTSTYFSNLCSYNLIGFHFKIDMCVPLSAY